MLMCEKEKQRHGVVFSFIFFVFEEGEEGGGQETKRCQDEAPKVTKWAREGAWHGLPYTNCLCCACVRGGRMSGVCIYFTIV